MSETRVSDGYLYEGAHWTKEGSPYVLEDYVFVPDFQVLTIEAGVSVMSASTTPGEDPYAISVNGDLKILGTKEDPVRIYNLGYIYVSGSTTTIKYTLMQGTGIDANGSFVEIASSSISKAETAISARKSTVSVWGSEIVDNQKGIVSNLWVSGPVLSIFNGEAMGGIGNLEDLDPEQNIMEIKNSVIERNENFAIRNDTSNAIDARENWWGTSDGPLMSKIIGPVVVDPWKTEEVKEEKVPCCSNVLFLPGLKASRLYVDKNGFFGTSTNTLWEPNRNGDVEKLYLNSDGTSINSQLYTSDIIDSAFGVKKIYKSFIAMMDGVVAEKTINEWLPFAYDWRFNVSDIALKPNQYSTTTKLLTEEFLRLSENSKTGKVSIVAHSNGGLVAKMLGKELTKQGKLELLDKVVFVGVPQLGTPQAVVAMLHGEDEALAKGIVLSKKVARTLGLNMPSAYGLLPGAQYFDQVIAPVVSFASSTINSYQSFMDFLIGKTMKRTQPKESDLETPAILSEELLVQAGSIHNSIDNWKFPEPIKSIFLSGWGKYTTETIKYLKDSFSILKTVRGDGTVLADVAKGTEADTIFLNQALLERDTGKEIKHADILESKSIEEFISTELTNKDAPLPPYLSRAEPNLDDYPWLGALVVSVHSPVEIDVYDEKGGHVGIVPFKDVVPGYEDSDLMWIDNTIPGAQYEDLAGHKYVYLPPDNGHNYSVQIKGTDVGTFTFQIQKFDNYMREIASSTYTDLPVTPLLTASTTINSLTMTPSLNLDFDGDGRIDAQVTPATTTDSLIYLESIKKVILAMHLKPAVEKALLLKIERAKKLIGKGKNGKLIERFKKFKNKIDSHHWKAKKLTESDRKTIVMIIESLLENLD